MPASRGPSRSWRVLTGLVTAVVAFALMASPAASLSSAPARPGDFPDPFVLKVGTRYYAYSTQVLFVNVPVVQSTDLKSWSSMGEALPKLPSWATWGHTWAPSVLPIGGRYVLYYSVRQTSSGRQCISRAVSSSPAGPFTDSSTKPLICQLSRAGSIDPSPFIDANGRPHLVWKSEDNALGNPTRLWTQPLGPDGLSLAGTPTSVLRATQTWQAGIIEGPSMLYRRGTYFLFYGANRWDTSSAAIGYATCSGPAGPCTNRAQSGPWLRSHDGGRGPSGPEVFTDVNGKPRLAYHAWVNGVGYDDPDAARALWLEFMSFSDLVPTLR